VDEAEIMARHATYWTELLQSGLAIVFGPVADPQGGSVLGIVRASSKEEANSLRDALEAEGFYFAHVDPTKYEILPMPQ
jgi:uncharacterized protein YciI